MRSAVRSELRVPPLSPAFGALSRRRAFKLGAAGVLGTAVAAWPSAQASAATGTDLVVYGATPAGLMAAIQAIRMGRTAVVLEPTSHVGGMATGGLGNTDVGAPDTIGGLAAEFYRRIGKRYGLTDGSPRYVFEPSVAAAVLSEMVTEAGLVVRTKVRLRMVMRDGNRLSSLISTTGLAFHGRVFIDATYEGDLMAAAAVSSTVGRESNAQYAETSNGVQLRPKAPLETVVDPYVALGQKSSGLLPGVSAKPVAPNGSADGFTQAYGFRMCLTQAADRIPFAKPEGYDSAVYELMRRYIEKGNVGPFFNFCPVGGGKYDVNNLGPYSSDFVGQNMAYPTATLAERSSIISAHRAYQQGLMWFLVNDPGLPAQIRADAASWGLAPDEFTATGGWSPQLYVREARRMRSDYVMTENDCRGARVAADSVGLASYGMDCHSVQRVVVDGEVRPEGWLQAAPPGPYPVSYRSIVPRRTECDNLLVPVCLSASHVAYASIRMEPVFMILGQSAGTAAALAVIGDCAVQELPYPVLRAQLAQDQQVLDWPPLPVGDVIVDNASYTGVTFVGRWTVASGTSGYFGSDYAINDRSSALSLSLVRFTPTLPKAGRYTVYLRWTAAGNRSSNVPVEVIHLNGTTHQTVNQRVQGGQWVPLGTFSFAAGSTGTVLIRAARTNGYTVADAVRFAPAN